MDNPIGIFDSGVGGLTVVDEIIRQLPMENLIYFGDTARVPYGPRSQAQVRDFVFEIIETLIDRRVKIVVIACNTATAAGLVEAQAHFEVPIVGVIEPGARGAVQGTKNRRVGVVGTVGTVNSGAYSRAVRAIDAGATVFSAACPKFVEIVEKGMISDANFLRPKTYNLAKTYLTPLLRARVDTLILGCTHYPLLSGLLEKVSGPDVTLISSARETAAEVKTIIERRGQLRREQTPPHYHFAASGDVKDFAMLGTRFLGRRLADVERIQMRDADRDPMLT